MKTIRIIVNRQKAAFNRKQKDRGADALPEEPTLSIHQDGHVDYAFGVRLTGNWNIVQDYANSPCSGAHIWLENADASARCEITHRKPQSEFDAVQIETDSEIGSQSQSKPEPKKARRNRW